MFENNSMRELGGLPGERDVRKWRQEFGHNTPGPAPETTGVGLTTKRGALGVAVVRG